MGDGAAETCWLCAHSIIVHGTKLGAAIADAELCKCRAEDIYPAPVILRQAKLGIVRTIGDDRPLLKLEVGTELARAQRFNHHRANR